MGHENIMDLNIELRADSKDEDIESMDQDGNNRPKNGFMMGSDGRARQSS